MSTLLLTIATVCAWCGESEDGRRHDLCATGSCSWCGEPEDDRSHADCVHLDHDETGSCSWCGEPEDDRRHDLCGTGS